jgi:ATPase subunit of ABC transporter with duplicated ATPase domains
MDSRVAILGANGTGKSTLLHLIKGALQPCEGTISKHAALKLAKYSQHSADQLLYDKSPIEYFQGLFAQKYPEKDVMVSWGFSCSVVSRRSLMLWVFLGLAGAVGSVWVIWCTSDVCH